MKSMTKLFCLLSILVFAPLSAWAQENNGGNDVPLKSSYSEGGGSPRSRAVADAKFMKPCFYADLYFPIATSIGTPSSVYDLLYGTTDSDWNKSGAGGGIGFGMKNTKTGFFFIYEIDYRHVAFTPAKSIFGTFQQDFNMFDIMDLKVGTYFGPVGHKSPLFAWANFGLGLASASATGSIYGYTGSVDFNTGLGVNFGAGIGVGNRVRGYMGFQGWAIGGLKDATFTADYNTYSFSCVQFVIGCDVLAY